METRVVNEKELGEEFDKLLDDCGPVWHLNGSAVKGFVRGSGIRGWARGLGYDPERVRCVRVRPLNRYTPFLIGILKVPLGDP